MTNGTSHQPRVRSGRGAHWVGQALAMVAHRPGVFMTMGLIVGAIYLVPLLGGLVLLVLGPAVLAGAVIAARDADRGGHPGVGHMFQLFQEESRLGQGLRLCVPLVAGQLLAGFVIGIPVARAMLRAGLDLAAVQSHPEVIVNLMGASLLLWAGLALLVMLCAYAFTATAIAQVALNDRPAFAAMAESLRLVRTQPGAWIVTALLLFGGMFVLALLVVALGVPALAQAVCYAALYAVLGPLLYAAWRDLCVPAADHETTGAPPPQVLEA
ncbi:MAG TPA: BPSS1780 family membrane protein [Rhodanobacteraceae bacterium]|nr:BPSS1780 family membrane protein [Rhodanobacteraceae bacterium]